MKLSISILFLACTTTLFSQSWPWATAPTSTFGSGVDVFDASLDPSENLYTSSILSGTVICGPNTLVNTGTCSIAIIKLDQFGNILWGQSTSEIGKECYNSIATDNLGNSLVAGAFASQTLSAGSVTLTLNGTCTNVFLGKWDTNGNLLWAQNSNGNSCDQANEVCVDASGNYYITGSFSSNNFSLGTNTVTNSTGTDMVFTAKIDPAGNVLWLRNGVSSGTGKAWGKSIAADASGNTVLIGSYTNTLTLGTYTLVAPPGAQGVFYAKYDTNGNVIWANTSGSSSTDNGNSVCTDVSGNYYLTGDYKSSVLSIGTFTLGKSGLFNMFVAKLDGNGNILWAMSSISAAGESGMCISSSSTAIYVGGSMGNMFSFNTYSITMSPFSMWDPAFILRMDPNGNVLCGDGLMSGADDKMGIVTPPTGNHAYFAGDFLDKPFYIGTYTLTYTGGANAESMFAAKFQCSPLNIQDSEKTLYKPTFYPVPCDGSFYLNAETEMKSGEVIIYNLIGEKVFENKLCKGLNSITTDLPDGMYTYKILEIGRPRATGKLLICR